MMEEVSTATNMLRPAVYVLRLRGSVVWIGAARKPLVRIYAHAVQRRGDILADFLPARPVEFDSIELIPCRVENLEREQRRVREELGWAPPKPRAAAHPIDFTRLAANA